MSRDLLDVQVGRAGVEAGEFEQVDHHAVESADLADHHVECLLCAFGNVLAAGVEHLHGRGRAR